MSAAAFTGWAIGAGYVAAFLLLTMIAARRAGRSLWLFDRPGQALPAWGFRIGFVLLVIWPTVADGWSQSPIWALVAAIGAGLALWSQSHMGQSWRIGTAKGEIGALVADGPFAHSRNPVFVGQMLLVWALVPLAGPAMLAAAGLITLAAIAQVRAEEAVLSHDPAWRDYATRTPRWFGPL